jgi:Flp pilus assembly protein TadB
VAAVIAVFAGWGLAVVGLVRTLWPGRVDLVTAVGRVDAVRRRPDERTSVVADGGSRLTMGQVRLGQWLIAEAAARGVRLGARNADLELLGRSAERLAGLQATAAICGALVPAAGGIAAAAVAGVTPPPILLLAVPGLAGGFWFLPAIDVRRAAAARRGDFTRALGSFLDLVTMSLAGGRAVAEALPSAAMVSNGWAFALLADAITGARLAGRAPWLALGELGRRIGVAELEDLASALVLVADDGARIRDSIAARAATLRRRQLADAEGSAARADQSMHVAQVVLAFGFLLLILYPAGYQVVTF